MMRQKMILAVLGAVVGQSALAQEGGTSFVFGLNSGIRASDNWTMVPSPSDTSFQFKNGLSFGAYSETRTSKASIDLGVDLHHTEIAGSPKRTGFSNPTARVAYTREGPASSLALNAGVAQSDQEIDFSDSLGKKTKSDLGASYAFGTGQKFGGSVSANHSETTYDGATDDDTRTTTSAGSLHFQVSPNLLIRPSLSSTRHEIDDGADSVTTTQSFGVGITAEIDEVSKVRVDLSQKEIDSSSEGKTTGTTGSIAYELAAPNGTHIFSVSSDISNDGPRTGVNYNRTIQMAQSQASYGIGASRGSDGSNQWTASFDFSRPLQRGDANANLSRAFTTDVEGNEVLTTTLGARLSRDIDEISGIDLSLSYKDVEETADSDSIDGTLSISYRRMVAENWNLTAGIEHRYSDDDASDPIRGNTVFVTFARTWKSSR